MTNMDIVVNFCSCNGYTINVNPLKKGVGCTVEFPANIFKKMPAQMSTFHITDKVEVYNQHNGNIDEKVLDMPKHLIVPFISASILKHSQALGIPNGLICAKLENKPNPSIFDIVKIDLEEKEKEKEGKVLKSVDLIFTNQKPSDEDIVEDFVLLRSFF